MTINSDDKRKLTLEAHKVLNDAWTIETGPGPCVRMTNPSDGPGEYHHEGPWVFPRDAGCVPTDDNVLTILVVAASKAVNTVRPFTLAEQSIMEQVTVVPRSGCGLALSVRADLESEPGPVLDSPAKVVAVTEVTVTNQRDGGYQWHRRALLVSTFDERIEGWASAIDVVQFSEYFNRRLWANLGARDRSSRNASARLLWRIQFHGTPAPESVRDIIRILRDVQVGDRLMHRS